MSRRNKPSETGGHHRRRPDSSRKGVVGKRHFPWRKTCGQSIEISTLIKRHRRRRRPDRGCGPGVASSSRRAGFRHRPHRPADCRFCPSKPGASPSFAFQSDSHGPKCRHQLRGHSDRRRRRAHGPRPDEEGLRPLPALFRRHSHAIMNMGLTAEYLAGKYRRQPRAAGRVRPAQPPAPRPGPPTKARSRTRSSPPGVATKRRSQTAAGTAITAFARPSRRPGDPAASL